MTTQQPERLFTRVKIQHVKGKEFGNWYNRESLSGLSLKKDDFEGSEFLEVGNNIQLDGKEYIIANINFKLETELWDMSSRYGVNILSSTDPTDFNVTINVFVDTIS